MEKTNFKKCFLYTGLIPLSPNFSLQMPYKSSFGHIPVAKGAH